MWGHLNCRQSVANPANVPSYPPPKKQVGILVISLIFEKGGTEKGCGDQDSNNVFGLLVHALLALLAVIVVGAAGDMMMLLLLVLVVHTAETIPI
jgi:hypothetical protein